MIPWGKYPSHGFDMVILLHYLQGFIQGGAGFLNHQQYHSLVLGTTYLWNRYVVSKDQWDDLGQGATVAPCDENNRKLRLQGKGGDGYSQYAWFFWYLQILMVWGKALYSSMKVISNSGWTILTIWLMLHGSFKFGGKYHTTSKLGRESTERQTSAGDVVFSTSENFLKKAAGWTAA